jgi:hypothetical protein
MRRSIFITRKWTSGNWYGFWNYGGRDAPARWRPARVALRYRRLRLGQHRNSAPIMWPLVHLPAHAAAPMPSAWRRP